MGLGHNPLTRESVCILWTPNKVAGGNQPSVSGRKAAAGTAWSPSVTLWEGRAVGGTVSFCLPGLCRLWKGGGKAIGRK